MGCSEAKRLECPKIVIFAETLSSVTYIYLFLTDALEENAFVDEGKNPKNRPVSLFYDTLQN